MDICGGRVGRAHNRSRRTRSVLPGSESTGNDQEGSPGTWETPSFPPQFPAREPEYQLPGAPGRASAADGSKPSTHRWYRQAKATKRGEMDGGESERPVVPSKPGNHSEGTRWREGDAVS